VEAKQKHHVDRWARRALGAFLLTILAGCSSQAVTRGPVDARAAGGLDARSASTLVPSDLAFGRDVANVKHSQRSETPDVDAYLKPQPTVVAGKTQRRLPAAPERKQPAPEPALPAPPVIALAPEAESAAQAEPLASETLVAQNTLPSGDMERYAQRERSRDLSGYRGGDAIVITSGTLIVALLIVLLVVLLT
jgi:hypothetical protein